MNKLHSTLAFVSTISSIPIDPFVSNKNAKGIYKKTAVSHVLSDAEFRRRRAAQKKAAIIAARRAGKTFPITSVSEASNNLDANPKGIKDLFLEIDRIGKLYLRN